MAELDRAGRDELHYAAAKNDVEGVRERIAAGVDVDLAERRSAFTPLHFAVQEGAVDAATALLDAGADLEACTAPRRMTPLILAASRWFTSEDGAMLRLLLDRGARRDAVDNGGRTAHDIAGNKVGIPDGLVELLVP